MKFERFFDPDLAQCAYAVACTNAKEAMIIDPLRDIDQYLDWAADNGCEITAVLETHIHADFVSGARELAAGTGARFLVGKTSDYENLDRFDARQLGHGDAVRLGSIAMRALHTPGHTMEHISLSVLESQGGTDRYVFTGDFMFDGELGRPDLADQCDELAEAMFRTLKKFHGAVVDDAVVWPGHGAGSACGRSLGELPATSPGREHRESWWSDYVENDDFEGFKEEFTGSLPTPPAYFERMKKINAAGPEIVGRTLIAPRLSPDAFTRAHEAGAIVVDVREPAEFAECHVHGSYAARLPKLSTFAGAVVPYDSPIVVLCSEKQAEEASRKLFRVGFDQIVGWIPSPDYAGETRSMKRYDAREVHDLAESGDIVIVDVRSDETYEEGHIPGAINVPYVELPDRYDELDRARHFVLHCESGKRATLAASALEAHGFEHVSVFPAGPSGWKRAGYQLETSG